MNDCCSVIIISCPEFSVLAMDFEGEVSGTGSVIWFRRGLRLHDNPALLKALSSSQELYPIFIYDGESAGTYLPDFYFIYCIMGGFTEIKFVPGIREDTGFNRVRFFLESLNDIDTQLKALGGKLHFIKGDPKHVFEAIHKARPLKHVAFEQVSLKTYFWNIVFLSFS